MNNKKGKLATEKVAKNERKSQHNNLCSHID